MVKKTIGEQTPGEAIRLSSAEVAFEQAGVTFKGSIRPNPPRQVNITSQAQLEAEFGENIELPDGIDQTISIDDSFTLTKPIKIGNGSLKLIGSTTGNIINYTGPGAMIRLVNPANPCFLLLVETLSIFASPTNSLFDVKGSFIFALQDVFPIGFGSIGTLDFPQMRIIGLNPVLTRTGLIIKCLTIFTSTSCFITPNAEHEMTFYSFIQGNPITTSVTRMVFAGATSDDSLIFYDPNSPLTTSMIITECTRGGGNLFQLGTEIPATANAASGSGTQFNITAHNLTVGKVVVLKDFTTFPLYNETFVVTAINDPNSVDIEVGFLGVDSTGAMDATSLDSEAVQIFADTNTNSPPSMSQTELRQGNPIVFTSIIGTFVPFQNAIPVVGDFIGDPATERYTINESTGVVTYNGIEPITRIFDFKFNIFKSGGGTVNMVTTLFQNTLQIAKTDKVIALTSTIIPISFRGYLEIQLGDTFQLKGNSSDNAGSTINVSDIRVLAE